MSKEVRNMLNKIQILLNENSNVDLTYEITRDDYNSGFGQEIFLIDALFNNTKIGFIKIRIFVEENKAEVLRVEVFEDYRRKGFATQLYLTANNFCDTYKSKLSGGEVQNDDAKKLWNSLVKKGFAEFTNDKYYFK